MNMQEERNRQMIKVGVVGGGGGTGEVQVKKEKTVTPNLKPLTQWECFPWNQGHINVG